MKKKGSPTAQAKNGQKKHEYTPTIIQISAHYKDEWKEENRIKLETIKLLLVTGKYDEAYDELNKIRFFYDPARVAIYRMHIYGFDGMTKNLSWFMHLVHNSAASGHIPSMYLLAKLIKSGATEDKDGEAELWEKRTKILDPGGVWDYDMLDPETTPSHMLVEDVLNAFDEGEGTSPYYHAHNAAQKATKYGIPPCPERYFSEPVGGPMYDTFIAKVDDCLHREEYDKAQDFFEQARKYDDIAAILFLARHHYEHGRRKDFFNCIKYGACYDCVPCMFTISACYRYGYGVERCEDYADAWYWMATQSDIDNRGLKETILLNV